MRKSFARRSSTAWRETKEKIKRWHVIGEHPLILSQLRTRVHYAHAHVQAFCQIVCLFLFRPFSLSLPVCDSVR